VLAVGAVSQSRALARQPVPVCDVRAVLRDLDPALSVRALQVAHPERRLGAVAARLGFEQPEASNAAVAVPLEHEGINAAILRAGVVGTAALVGAQQPAPVRIVRQNQQARARWQRHHEGGRRLELDLPGPEPLNQGLRRHAERPDQAGEIAMRERDPMAPAAVATPVACEREMLGALQASPWALGQGDDRKSATCQATVDAAANRARKPPLCATGCAEDMLSVASVGLLLWGANLRDVL